MQGDHSTSPPPTLKGSKSPKMLTGLLFTSLGHIVAAWFRLSSWACNNDCGVCVNGASASTGIGVDGTVVGECTSVAVDQDGECTGVTGVFVVSVVVDGECGPAAVLGCGQAGLLVVSMALTGFGIAAVE